MPTPVITTFAWVPPFARGFVRDLRARWACEEEGIPYELRLVDGAATKGLEHRRFQPFGQVPCYSDGDVTIFESGAIVLRIAELGGTLLPADPAARMRAIQWVFAALNSVEPWVVRGADEGDNAEVQRDLQTRLGDLQAALGDRQWLEGDGFTVGDLMMVSVLGYLRETDALATLPGLAAYVARGEARPGHVKAMGDQLALYAEADKARG